MRPATPDEAAFCETLVQHGLLIPSGVPGLYGRGVVFESVRVAFDRLVDRCAAPDNAEPLRFPPLIPRRTLERSGYLKSFPHLAGSVFSFDGDERDAAALQDAASRGGDWSAYQSMTDVTLVPAACYPSYPAIARRGALPADGVTLDLGGCYVFRHEPSGDPARLQMFHQREIVRIGSPDQVLDWRETWMRRAEDVYRRVGLAASVDRASDPFFGRGGRMLAASQREGGLKFEVLVPIASPQPTAVTSFNYHQDHFGSTFGIVRADGQTAHSACLGFGLERVTLALLHRHGLDPQRWPDPVRDALWGDA
jgi:seryl-tRNA synthetase